jgi:hypothetical protein
VRSDVVETVTPKVLLRDVREGLRYVRARPGLVAVLIMVVIVRHREAPENC